MKSGVKGFDKAAPMDNSFGGKVNESKILVISVDMNLGTNESRAKFT
jgi:hypothetical protein